MSIYLPNESELDMMRAILLVEQWNLGLYKNALSMDGSLSMLLVQEMPSGAGRTYAQKALTMDFAAALAANKWYLSLNSSGKAEGAYHNSYLEWDFAAADVADINTVQGVFAFIWVVPFDAGQSEGPIKVGDTITGFTSAATGVVTGVLVSSGSWAGDDAAGLLFIKAKTGTFQNNEELRVGGVKWATSDTGTIFAGDAHKKLVFLEELPDPKLIDTAGQKIRVTLKWTLSTA